MTKDQSKRCEELIAARLNLKYDPISLDEIAEGEFREGYRAGLQDNSQGEIMKELVAVLEMSKATFDKINKWDSEQNLRLTAQRGSTYIEHALAKLRSSPTEANGGGKA